VNARPLVLALAVLLTACFSEHTTPPDDTVSFTLDVQPFLSGTCASSVCHGPNPPGKPMSLAAGQSYGNIVGVPSAQLPSMNRITPGNPDQSYLIHKLQGTHQVVSGTGQRMPAGQPPLAPSVIAMMRQWVSEGAQRN
jgi:hypothetical protein